MPRILLTAVLVVAALAVASPAASAAAGATGGSPAQPPAGSASEPADGQVVLSLPERRLLGRVVEITGRAGGATAGHRVRLQRRDPATGRWSSVATATTRGDGTFTTSWRTDRVGTIRLRGRLAAHAGARAAGAALEFRLRVFRPGVASWYGPGFYGRRTACGQRMTRALLGVAHRTLPCGTRVAFLYRGRTVTVPVVDRGPFIRGRTWDLTFATAQALRVPGTVRVGALPRRPATPPPGS